MKYLSLFSGIGGFELGIHYAFQDLLQPEELQHEAEDSERAEGGMDALSPARLGHPVCIGFSEIDKYATQVYQSHFPTHHNYEDIIKLNADTLPDFDLLVGGFPCQAFSIAGKRKGFDDTRGTLFFDIARILRAKQPRLFLLENVKGLLSHDNGKTFSTILSTLDELGYDLQWQVLNSKNHGVPQNRERVFIIGHLRGTSRPQVFPFTDDGRQADELSRHIANTLTARYEGAQAVGTYVGEGELNAQEIGVLDDYNHRMRTDGNVGTVRATFGNEAAGNGNKIVDGTKVRRLTPTECERLQGFPDNWCDGISDTQKYKCAGNAVTVNVIRDIMKRLL